MNKLVALTLFLCLSFQNSFAQVDYELGFNFNRDLSFRTLRSNENIESLERVAAKAEESPKWNYGGGTSFSMLVKDKARITFSLRYADFGYNTTTENAQYTFGEIEPFVRRYQAKYSYRTIIPAVFVENRWTFGKTNSFSVGGGLNNTILYHKNIQQSFSVDSPQGSRGRSSTVGSSNLRYLPGFVLTASLEKIIFGPLSFYLRYSYNHSLIAIDETVYNEFLYNFGIEAGLRIRLFSSAPSLLK